jgi:sugar lactone lactonase YvrE
MAASFIAETVVEHRCLLGEGPVWDERTATICWVDILNGEIHEYSPAAQTRKVIPVHAMVGSFAICTNGDFIAALQNGFAFIGRESGEIKMIADPELRLPGNRFNDGKCDPAGRFFAGTMSLSEEQGAGSLYMVDKDLRVTKKISQVTISNGMAWSIDRNIFYYIDSPTREVVSYDYDEGTGDISNKKTIIKIPEEAGTPDGMTIDTEGMLWIAHWDGWQVARWNPATGEQLLSFRLPTARITSCTFGGEAFQDLYITSAKVGLPDYELRNQKEAGALFVIRNCGFTGMPAYRFPV